MPIIARGAGLPMPPAAPKENTTKSINAPYRHNHFCFECWERRRCHNDACGSHPNYELIHSVGLYDHILYDKAFKEWFVPGAFFKACYHCKKKVKPVARLTGKAFRDAIFPSASVLSGIAHHLDKLGGPAFNQLIDPGHKHKIGADAFMAECNICKVTRGFFWLTRYHLLKIEGDDAIKASIAVRVLMCMADMMTK